MVIVLGADDEPHCCKIVRCTLFVRICRSSITTVICMPMLLNREKDCMQLIIAVWSIINRSVFVEHLTQLVNMLPLHSLLCCVEAALWSKVWGAVANNNNNIVTCKAHKVNNDVNTPCPEKMLFCLVLLKLSSKHSPAFFSRKRWKLTAIFSQGSVATSTRSGGQCCYPFVANSFSVLQAKNCIRTFKFVKVIHKNCWFHFYPDTV